MIMMGKSIRQIWVKLIGNHVSYMALFPSIFCEEKREKKSMTRFDFTHFDGHVALILDRIVLINEILCFNFQI